jgi:glycosyltransferase 2 family protein
MMGPRLKRALFVLVGILFTAAALALVFYRPAVHDGQVQFSRRFDFAEWVATLPSHLIWLVPFFLLSAALPALRALPWRFTAPTPEPDFAARYHGLALGGLVHNAAPGRLGLLVAAWFVARRMNRPVVELLFSLLVAKLLELGALVAVAASLLPLLTVGRRADASLGRTALAGVVLLCAFSILLVLLARYAPRLASALETRGRLPRLVAMLRAISAGVRGVGSLRRLIYGLLAALGPVGAAGLAYGLALAHVGAVAGAAGGWLLLAAVTLGQITPGLPIGTGVYFLVCSWGARALGASAAQAAAVAVLTHAATVLANLAVGAVSALRHRQQIREFLAFRRVRPSVE